ncbi:Adaptive-response sensory-kinase SasA [Sporomusa silvacetica DSM 10669]|uniref:histidine kinase n=1 Tax=Sporomusa silvacetica DSM 10669 TaxID=1123289 RepID=A0ABZ3IFR9_9FIRM|nr:PocR ligand-binding domain-containing protein [Sporomusa silvacetica]OZC17040.1 sporulation kinase E [Sporomusa silvacetica DSM 10669]
MVQVYEQDKRQTDDINNIKLTDVIDLNFLQRFQDDFAESVGLASVTVDVNGKPITTPSRYTRFCMDYTHSTECGDKRCAESHRKGGEEAARTGKPVVYECHAGLIDFAAPIILEGQLIGTILGGQILTHTPPEEKYRKFAKEIGVNEEGYVKAVNEVTILTQKRIEAAANVLYNVANSLSKMAYHERKLIKATDVLNSNLNQMSATMERLNVVGEMAASIGHEIRNPMTTVRGYLQLFQLKDDFTKYYDHFSVMIDELDRANSIITEYLSLAKNKAVKMKIGNINDVIQSLQPLLQADASCRGHQLFTDLGRIPDNKFDEKEIRQMILNLVRNGFEAAQDCGEVTIRTYEQNGTIMVSIKDNGTGIPDEVMQKLGTPFLTTKDNGTGLGIPICYRIAERHGAKLLVDSASQGTTITVVFKPGTS